jgi:ubiquinone/menaquinone biosynthesis C-methylase UbiE
MPSFAQAKYPRDLANMVSWIRQHAVGSRTLEIGCGAGALTRALTQVGFDVTGIDPHGPEHPLIQRVTIEAFRAAPFDVLVASVSLHHVGSLEAVAEALHRLSRSGSILLVREFDREALDHRPTLQWWFHQRQALVSVDAGAEPLDNDFETFVSHWREHMSAAVLSWRDVRTALFKAGFQTELESRGPYLFRWGLEEEVMPLESHLVAAGRIKATGVWWKRAAALDIRSFARAKRAYLHHSPFGKAVYICRMSLAFAVCKGGPT